jgi:hypothetical protein
MFPLAPLPTEADKRKARAAVASALRSGLISKPLICQHCLKPGRLEGHHPDYSQPLNVRWLHNRCHKIEEGRVILTDNQLDLARRLRNLKFSFRAIARRLGVSERSIREEFR